MARKRFWWSLAGIFVFSPAVIWSGTLFGAGSYRALAASKTFTGQEFIRNGSFNQDNTAWAQIGTLTSYSDLGTQAVPCVYGHADGHKTSVYGHADRRLSPLSASYQPLGAGSAQADKKRPDIVNNSGVFLPSVRIGKHRIIRRSAGQPCV
jgi:hypothetical protein